MFLDFDFVLGYIAGVRSYARFGYGGSHEQCDLRHGAGLTRAENPGDSLGGETRGSNGELEWAGLNVEESKLAIFGGRDGSRLRRKFAGEFYFGSRDCGPSLVDD